MEMNFDSSTVSGRVLLMWNLVGVEGCLSKTANLSIPNRDHIHDTGFIIIFVFPRRIINGTHGLINVISKTTSRKRSPTLLEFPKSVINQTHLTLYSHSRPWSRHFPSYSDKGVPSVPGYWRISQLFYLWMGQARPSFGVVGWLTYFSR